MSHWGLGLIGAKDYINWAKVDTHIIRLLMRLVNLETSLHKYPMLVMGCCAFEEFLQQPCIALTLKLSDIKAVSAWANEINEFRVT